MKIDSCAFYVNHFCLYRFFSIFYRSEISPIRRRMSVFSRCIEKSCAEVLFKKNIQVFNLFKINYTKLVALLHLASNSIVQEVTINNLMNHGFFIMTGYLMRYSLCFYTHHMKWQDIMWYPFEKLCVCPSVGPSFNIPLDALLLVYILMFTPVTEVRIAVQLIEKTAYAFSNIQKSDMKYWLVWCLVGIYVLMSNR